MGRYGYYVVDADGHGGEPLGWRKRVPDRAFTHPVGAMLALTCFTVGGVLHRFPELRVGFLEAGAGWLP